MPKALSIMWELVRSSKISDPEKAATLREMDKILGLQVFEQSKKRLEIPRSVLELGEERDILRKNKKFTQADHIRNRIEKMGYTVKDEGRKTVILRKI